MTTPISSRLCCTYRLAYPLCADVYQNFERKHMNKNLIAALVGIAFAGVAQAQTNVTLYGLADGGLRWDRTQAGTLTSVSGGGAAGSRWGIRGSEDLGNGIKANFVFEQGVDLSNNTVSGGGDTSRDAATSPLGSSGGRMFSRMATVGLSGPFGNLRVGRDYSPHYVVWAAADPSGTGLVATTNNVARGNITRFDNGIYYDSPADLLAGFKGSLALRLGESTTDSPVASDNAGNALSLGVSYTNGPIYAAYGFNHVRNAVGDGRTRSHVVAGTFSTGMAGAKLHGLYWRTDDNTPATINFVPAKARSWAVGASIPFAGFNLMANYGEIDDRSTNNADARFLGLAGTYAMSRRTDFYAAAARMNNRSNARYLITDASNTGLLAAVNVGAGYSPTSAQIGLRHRF